MPFTILVHVFPMSCVRKMYGDLSSRRKRFTAMYAVAESCAPASMSETRPNSGMSFGVTFVHVVPPSFVTSISPSSEPVQITLVVRFDGAIEKMTPYTSGPFMSRVIGPPDGPMVLGSWRVRSGLIFVQFSPPFVVFQR